MEWGRATRRRCDRRMYPVMFAFTLDKVTELPTAMFQQSARYGDSKIPKKIVTFAEHLTTCAVGLDRYGMLSRQCPSCFLLRQGVYRLCRLFFAWETCKHSLDMHLYTKFPNNDRTLLVVSLWTLPPRLSRSWVVAAFHIEIGTSSVFNELLIQGFFLILFTAIFH